MMKKFLNYKTLFTVALALLLIAPCGSSQESRQIAQVLRPNNETPTNVPGTSRRRPIISPDQNSNRQRTIRPTSRTSPRTSNTSRSSNNRTSPKLSPPQRSRSTSSSDSSQNMQILGPEHGLYGRRTGKPSLLSPKMKEVAIFLLETKKQWTSVGTPFEVSVKLTNPAGQKFDSLGFALQYNPDDVMPIQDAANDDNWLPAQSVQYQTSSPSTELRTDITKKAEEEKISQPQFVIGSSSEHTIVRNEVDDITGMIYFSVQFETPQEITSGVIAKIAFLPQRASESSTIDFVFSSSARRNQQPNLTFLTFDENDVLGTTSSPYDGVIAMDIKIVDEEELKTLSSRPQDDSSTILRLTTATPNINVFDTFDVQIELSNPNNIPIDQISVLLLYNPRVLEVIDSDLSMPGINIDNKIDENRFVFDFISRNKVDVDRGIINYYVQSTKHPLQAKGDVASITFRALRPTKKTTLKFLVNEIGQSPTTSVIYNKRDMLGEPDTPFDGIETTTLQIGTTTAYLDRLMRQNRSTAAK